MEVTAQGGRAVQREHLRRRIVEEDDRLVAVDGQNAFLQGVQDVLALEKLAGKGVGLIAQQGLLDAAGEALGQQRAQDGRHNAHGDETKRGAQSHRRHAAEVDPHDDKADHAARLVPDGGVGRVVRAHGSGLVGGVGGSPSQSFRLRRAGVGGTDEGPVRHIEEGGAGVAHQDQIDVRGVENGVIQVIGQLVNGQLSLEGLLEHGYLGENGGRVEEVVVQSGLLTAQGEVERAHQGEGDGHHHDHKAQMDQLGADGRLCLCVHGFRLLFHQYRKNPRPCQTGWSRGEPCFRYFFYFRKGYKKTGDGV